MSLILRTNLARPLTHLELDSNFTYLNIQPWVKQSYLQGQYVIYTLSGTTSLFYCDITHTDQPYTANGGNFTQTYFDGSTLLTLWTRIGGTGSGGATYSAVSLTGSTTGVTDIYAGEAANVFKFKSIKSLNSSIVITHDAGTIYINSTAPVTNPFAQTISHTNVGCYGASNGSITIVATGGTGTRRYSNNGGTSWTAYSSATTQVYSGLTAGTYTIQIQDQTLGVLASQAVTVTQPNNLNYAFNSLSFTNVTVSGMTNGTVTVTATGGTTPYQYKLNSGSWITPGSSTYVYTGLSAGSYTVYIQDAHGCTPATSKSVTVTYTYPRMTSFGLGLNNPPCHNGNGSINVSVVGGSGSYQYSMDGGAFGSTTSATSQTFSSIAPGSLHYFSIKDVVSGQILNTSSVSLVNPAAMVIATTGSTNVACGSGSASIYVKVKNSVGTPTIKFTGYGSTTFNMSPTVTGGTYTFYTSGTTALVSYLNAPGVHTGRIIVTDSTCNTITGSTSYNVHYYSPVTVAPTLINPANCPGDYWNYQIVMAGGSGSYQYSSDAGATWSAPTASTTITPFLIASSATGTTATTAPIMVRDSNNTSCSATTYVNNSRVTNLSASATSNNPTCASGTGSITVTASGGRVDIGNTYQYALITSGVTGSYQSSNIITGLVSGTYNVAVRRTGTTCTPVNLGSNITITVPRAVAGIYYSKNNPTSCGGSDGSITVTVSGGTGTYQYSTNNGSTWNGTNLTPTLGRITIPTLPAATYTILVKDSSGCIMTNGAFVIVLTAPTSPGFTVHSYTLPLCNGSNATITLTATGGTAPYQFSADGVTYAYAPSSGSTMTYSVTPYTTPAKTYYVKDVHACVSSTTVTGGGTVAAMTATLSLVSGSTVQITVANGVGSKSVSLYSGTTLVYSVSSVTSFPYTIGTYSSGTYHAVVTDANSCSATSNTVTISTALRVYWFRYSLDATSPNLYAEGGGNTYNLANPANVYYDAMFTTTYTLAQVLSTYIGAFGTYGGGWADLTFYAPTGWGSVGTITMTYGAVGYISNMAIAVPNMAPWTDLSTGNHLKAPPVTTPFNAAAKYIGAATVGGINYSLYDVVAPSSTSPAGTNTQITIS